MSEDYHVLHGEVCVYMYILTCTLYTKYTIHVLSSVIHVNILDIIQYSKVFVCVCVCVCVCVDVFVDV